MPLIDEEWAENLFKTFCQKRDKLEATEGKHKETFCSTEEKHKETFCSRVDEKDNKMVLRKLKELVKNNLNISRTKSRDSWAVGGNDKTTE